MLYTDMNINWNFSCEIFIRTVCHIFQSVTRQRVHLLMV